MPWYSMNRGRAWIALLLLLGLAAAPVRADDAITLKDGTKLSATVVSREREGVVVQIPRNQVASVNGEPLEEAVAEGSRAPDFTVVDLKGQTHTLADPAAKVTLLKFWASWCPFCRADIPAIKDLDARYRDKGLRVLAISVDQDPEKLKVFVAKEPLPYPVIPTSGEGLSLQQMTLPDRYETQGIPAYFLIAHGKIAKTIAGSVTAGKQDLETPIKQLLQ